MPADDRQPSELSNYIHLFLSGGDRERVSGTAFPEYVIWLIFPEGSPSRALFASGISSFIAGRSSPVTLIEVGKGLPNSGYYFALDPGRYLMPWVDRGTCINEMISPLLRFACSTESSFLKPFEDSFIFSSAPHFIINAFSYSSGREPAPLESIAERSSMYSLRNKSSCADPDALIIINRRPEEDAGHLLKRIKEFVPAASIFVAGRPGPDDDRVAGIETIPLPEMKEFKPEMKKPPSGGSFISFMNEVLQRISAGLRENGETAAG
ncbi:MAG: hypothetical protein R6U43_01520 [Candidatus Krumholzibacteriales bacterium]